MAHLAEAGRTRNNVSEEAVVFEHLPFKKRGLDKSGDKNGRSFISQPCCLDH